VMAAQSGGRFSLIDCVLPRDVPVPPHLHTDQDETFYVLEGELTAWLVEPDLVEDDSRDPEWVRTHGRRCTSGAVVFAPAGVPHTFRVESDTARMVFLSVPAGIEDYVRALAEPAKWPWLQPPPEGPRVSAERIAAIERRLGVIRHVRRLRPPEPPSDSTDLEALPGDGAVAGGVSRAHVECVPARLQVLVRPWRPAALEARLGLLVVLLRVPHQRTLEA
jgi:quercetin dioxygenase-like cupin family protein